MTAPVPADTLARLKAVLGEGGWSQDADRIAPKLVEQRGRWKGATPLLAMPKSTAEVSAVVGICAADGVAITPQGGNTGLVGGQIPQGEILLSTERMRAIRDINADDDAIVVEAGVTLLTVQEAAAANARRFPLSLASEGSATIGGLISTNAGGTQVLRYGTMRALVLGLEAVLPDGSVWNGLKRLRKDATGYDLKQFLIGAEGTLGIVTAASLKLFPVLASRAVAIVGLANTADAVTLLGRAKAESGGQVEAFELMGRQGVEFAIKNIEGTRDFLEQPYPWIALIEIATGAPGEADAALERVLTSAFEDGLITDAAVAQSETQAKAMWALRENQNFGQKPEGSSWKHDVSVPVSQAPLFIERADAALLARWPTLRIVAFGHVGDGNIHYNITRPADGTDAEHDARRDEAGQIVHDIAVDLGGSISAEHGLGVAKTEEALRYKPAVEVAAARAIRAALDPGRIMNPRVLF